MPRTIEEWIGKTADSQIPPRVKLRVLIRFASCCGLCRRPLFGRKCVFDHRIALINGGENRESNIIPAHESCHKAKTALDVAYKSLIARAQRRHYGIRGKSRSRPLIGTVASGWRHFMSGGWERR